ncbi:hypothetical protein Taro_019789, partial [Colocasia esculenta]|nr:hypothetical protein [Colocasia esculenta]
AMVSRGRRGAQAREDEQRHEERGEQQSPAPQGPTILPPPPPVDYDVFLQGLVQAMQTQVQTKAALQAQLQAHAQAPAPIPQEHGHGGPSIMERFKRMAPPSFKGESQPLLAESWMREVEKIFRAIRCAEEDKVSLATYMLQALSTACKQESEMDQYLEEKKTVQKRFVPPFQRQDRKTIVYQSPQRLVEASSQQAVTPQSLGFRPSDKKACPHCGRAHSGNECWKLEGKCLKCGSTEHQIWDCPRLQQDVQRGAPAAAAAALVIGIPGRPRAQARVFALACEDAEKVENVTKGTVLVMGVHARVLFDTSATNSFIFEQFAKQLAVESGVEAEELEVPLSVHTPVRGGVEGGPPCFRKDPIK